MRRWKTVVHWVAATAALGLVVGFVGCSTVKDEWEDVPGGPPRVLVSFPPLYCFAKNVAGPDAAVLSVLTTIGPHDFRPEPPDSLKVRKADLFLVNGLGLDDFITRMVGSSGNPKITVVKIGEAVPVEQRLEIEEHDHDDGHMHEDGHHHHDHGSFDPHVWLGPPEAILMVERIRDVLSEKAPQHKDGYHQRAKAYIEELRQLHKEGKDLLDPATNPKIKGRKIISTHESLGYFARAFGLEIVGSIQPQAGVEADAGQLAKLVNICQKENIRVITVEPQYSKATAETLLRQLRARVKDVQLVEVDTLETAVPPEGDGPHTQMDAGYYTQKMRANIQNLAKHLQ